MQIFFHRTTLYLTLITLAVLHASDLNAAADPFAIQVFDGETKMPPPYTLISGKRYRLQAVSTDQKVLPARWFLAGNLGRITTGEITMLTAVFVGEGSLICRVAGTEQRAKLSVVPATKTIGSSGGKLQSPAGAEIALPEGALAIEQQIGIEIVASPGLLPTAQRFGHVIRISPAQLVLKRPARLTFFLEGIGVRNPSYMAADIGVRNPSHRILEAQLQIYFWERFGKKWVPLQGRANTVQDGVTTSINHFGIYTLMAPASADLKRADRVQIQNVMLSPRVFFAPDTHRLTITYQINAPDTMQAFITMDIFDLRGRRIRRLLADAPRYTGPNAAQWDGLTDDSSLIRNGRYLLVIRARTGSQRAVQRKLIVVFK